MLKWFLVIFTFLSSHSICYGAPKLAEGPGIGVLYYIKVIFYLGIIMGVLYLLHFFLKNNLPEQNKIKLLKIIDKTYLEQGVSVYVIRVLDKNWLIGVGNKEIKMIEKLGEIDYSTGEILTDNINPYGNIVGTIKKQFLINIKRLIGRK